uniref:Chromodomain helicase DNA binding protein 1 like n=1 Tax=Pan paniscus TaxID=9597 RepID=A0A2R9C259_PANPA
MSALRICCIFVSRDSPTLLPAGGSKLARPTIALFIYLAGRLNDEGPFLILCPLSVLNVAEILLFILIKIFFLDDICSRSFLCDKEERACLQQDLKQESRFHVLLTTYEICLKDASFLKSFPWSVLVVDEAHRLKNQSSLLHKTLSEFSVVFSLLLTGTPIQNSLQELYSLLSFILFNATRILRKNLSQQVNCTNSCSHFC